MKKDRGEKSLMLSDRRLIEKSKNFELDEPRCE